MTEEPVLSEGELAAFVSAGFVVLGRPLTWEIIGELLAALPSTEEGDSE
ncbi:MAG: hypothetical protein HYW07_09965 [Candidatus Latescibacteria bacterium]|nr:hypothetical protein [Candidatus Latescibacterota bacterium]